MTTYEKVVAIIAEQFDVAQESITVSTRFKEDLQADSIAVVELVMAFEEAFGESISDEEAETLTTVQDVITYIETHQ